MKIYLTIIIIWITGVAINAQVNGSMTNSSINNDSIINDIPFLNADKNVDSLIRAMFAQEPVSGDTALPVEIDTSQYIYTDIPDSVYISRIKRIPSAISLTYNEVVKRYIEVYTIKKRDKLQEMLGLKDFYFPMIEEILDSYCVPQELKYLSVIESALNPRAVSRAGATGLWQFMYHTGRLYNLTINSYIDERRDPVLATKAAAKYLKDAYGVYNDWVLAIAAYNCGAGNVNKAIRRSGGKTNYWDIYPYLPRETRGYVPAFIAAAYSITYYKDHDLIPVHCELPPETDTIMINENIHLRQVADVMRIPMDLLKELNPQYRLDIIPGRYGACPLRLPETKTTQFIDLQDSILKYKHEIFFSGDFKIINPTYRYKSSRYASAPPSKNLLKLFYTVKRGDNLGGIAESYKVRTSDLRYWNDITRNNIRIGQQLVIYVPKVQTASREKTTIKANADTSKPTINTTNQFAGYIYYQVKSGDNLWKIASQYPGVSNLDIIKWNKLSNPEKIKPGQTIIIKKIDQ